MAHFPRHSVEIMFTFVNQLKHISQSFSVLFPGDKIGYFYVVYKTFINFKNIISALIAAQYAYTILGGLVCLFFVFCLFLCLSFMRCFLCENYIQLSSQSHDFRPTLRRSVTSFAAPADVMLTSGSVQRRDSKVGFVSEISRRFK